MKVHLRDSPVWIEGGIENVEVTEIPASLGRPAKQGIPTLSDDPPSPLAYRYPWERVERVQEIEVTRSPLAAHRSQVRCVFEPVDYGEYFLCAAVVDQINSPLALEEWMWRMEPKAGFLW
jgi:hypothetical protein